MLAIAIPSRPPGQCQGVTLIELLATIVIISIALAAVSASVGNTVSRSADPLIQHRTVLLAQAYAEEVLGKRFAESTPLGGVPAATDASVCTLGAEGGETRALFDDVDDYHGLSESPPALQSGSALNGYTDYTAAVSVSCAGTALGLANNHDAKAIDISITAPDGRTSGFRVYRGNY